MTRHYPLLSTLRPLLTAGPNVRADAVIREVQKLRRQVLRSQHWQELRDLFRSDDMQGFAATAVDLSGDSLKAALSEDANQATLEKIATLLVPWRVGPYQLGGLEIDAEWRSHLKWSRIAPLLSLRSGMRIADVGCSSGYFLFKLAAHSPELALGFDPVDRCWLQFALLQSIFRLPHVGFVPLGLHCLESFPEFFDLIICMGVMYHQRDPLAATRQIFGATREDGQVIIESLVIDRPGTDVLVPEGRYAKMRNAWVIPTPEALASYMTQSGFRDVTIHRFGPVTIQEQRRTTWAPYESLSDFLDPNDCSKTVEGYPAPHSAVVVGRK